MASHSQPGTSASPQQHHHHHHHSHKDDPNVVLSDPMGALSVQNGKACQDCTELYLSCKGIERLAGFQRFVNLGTLWLNGNKLTKINNLDHCTRIQRLYCHDNCLTTLKGSLSAFTFLDTLTLQNNRLQDLHHTLVYLKELRHLQELDLHGNPLAEETKYRLHVIKALPSLQVLDRHVITEDERREAKKVKSEREQLEEDERLLQMSRRVKSKPTERYMRAKGIIEAALDEVRLIVKTQRILLKEHFMEEDPRREWVVDLATFKKYLNLYGLISRIATHDDTNGPYGDFVALELLAQKYGSEPPVRSCTLGRDKTFSQAKFVDYVAFCRDVEPAFGSRDVDNARREREAALDRRLGPTVDDKIPLSNTVKGLIGKVNDFKDTIARKAREDRTMLVTMGETRPAALRAPMAKSEEDFVTPCEKLDPWETTELLKLLKAAKSFDKKADRIAKVDVKECLKMMVRTGRVMVDKDLAIFVDRERSAAAELRRSADLDPEPVDTSLAPIDRLLAELAGFGPDKGQVGCRQLMKTLAEGSGPVPPPTWRGVTHAEAKNEAKVLYAQARQINQRLALGGGEGSTQASKDADLLKVKELVASASKLERIAEGEVEARYSQRAGNAVAVRGDAFTVKTMHEVIKKGHKGVHGGAAEVPTDPLSDDEDEGRNPDDTDEIWEAKSKAKKLEREMTAALKKKLGLKDELQDDYRKMLHTRRPKDIEKATRLLVTSKRVLGGS